MKRFVFFILAFYSLSTWAAEYTWSLRAQIAGVYYDNIQAASVAICALYSQPLTSIDTSGIGEHGNGMVAATCQPHIARYPFDPYCPYGGYPSAGKCVGAPECPQGQIRDANGQCVIQPTCNAGEAATVNSFVGWSLCDDTRPECRQRAQDSLTYCDGSCYIAAEQVTQCTGGNGTFDQPKPVYCSFNGKKTGATCTTSNVLQPGAPPVIPNNKPKCGPDQGVMTSSKGTVACVPSGTPGATTPKVTTDKKVENFGDGSSKTTETTTTTDTKTGAKEVTVKVTIEPATGGGAGQAGTPGTTVSNTDHSKTTSGDPDPSDETPEEGDCDPAKDMCGSPGTDGLYAKKGKTVQTVLQNFRTGFVDSALGTSIRSFFQITIPASACPGWVVDIPYLNTSFNIGAIFCASYVITAMQMAGWVCLFLATFVAFRWAIL